MPIKKDALPASFFSFRELCYIGSMLIRANWQPAPIEIEEAREQIKSFLIDLKELSPIFSQWFLQGKTKAEALEFYESQGA